MLFWPRCDCVIFLFLFVFCVLLVSVIFNCLCNIFYGVYVRFQVVKKVPDIVERGVCIVCSDWMTSSSSAMVTDEYTSSWLQMAVSPFPQSESPASEVELMPNDVRP
jgi:hypothetical protein